MPHVPCVVHKIPMCSIKFVHYIYFTKCSLHGVPTIPYVLPHVLCVITIIPMCSLWCSPCIPHLSSLNIALGISLCRGSWTQLGEHFVSFQWGEPIFVELAQYFFCFQGEGEFKIVKVPNNVLQGVPLIVSLMLLQTSSRCYSCSSHVSPMLFSIIPHSIPYSIPEVLASISGWNGGRLYQFYLGSVLSFWFWFWFFFCDGPFNDAQHQRSILNFSCAYN